MSDDNTLVWYCKGGGGDYSDAAYAKALSIEFRSRFYMLAILRISTSV